jgi:hypothetical protein
LILKAKALKISFSITLNTWDAKAVYKDFVWWEMILPQWQIYKICIKSHLKTRGKLLLLMEFRDRT